MVKRILLSLCNHLNIETNKELAEYLGIKITQIYSWRKHGKITDTGKILAKIPHISLRWLETGEGPMMMIIDQNNTDPLPEGWKKAAPPPVKPKISTTRVPENDRLQQSITNNKKDSSSAGPTTTPKHSGQTTIDDDFTSWSMSDMLVMTTAVLESKTAYCSALASNVRAFYQAVKNEEKMESIVKKLKSMESKNTEMAKRMERMEKMLISLGGGDEPQKGNQTNK